MAVFLKASGANQYQQFVFGTWGSFSTRAGRVDFLETKARLSNPPDTTPESRLTQFLRPVREALPIAEMNFNQLLQRDLDDHRVAVELVPYLLNPDKTGPAFFPPVVACLLPFTNRVPQPSFPLAHPIENISDFGLWKPVEYGAAFRFDLLLEDPATDHPCKLGRLNWNPEATELVIIDGQHRAMAVLAIDRTINNRWTGGAEKYKAFYEPTVKRCLEGMSETERQIAFKAVELPVVIIWFPALPANTTHHQAARKVFVDLNKNARPPSASRLLLLSDKDLVSIFTREILNDMRTDGAGYPIFAVEYDNPDRDQSSSAKWSTLTNVSCIFEATKRLICGPEKFFADMASTFVGRDSETQMRLVLKQSLDLIAALPETIVDDKIYSREEIDSYNFPPTKIKDFCRQFNEGWGYLLKKLFAELTPFQAHAQALRQLGNSWIPIGQPAASLAKEAIFEGVGLYWTLRDSEDHWRGDNQRRKEEGKPALPRTDVIDAWDGTQAKKAEFIKLRAKTLLGSQSKVPESESAFGAYSTAACQIGFVLAARSVAKLNNIEYSAIKPFVDALITSFNAALVGRELYLARSNPRSINLLPKLDTPYAVYFRYFWLELLNSVEGVANLGAHGYSISLQPLCEKGRWHYREFLIKQSIRAQRSINGSLTEEKAREIAKKQIDKELKSRLKSLFALNADAYQGWITRCAAAAATEPPTAEDQNSMELSEAVPDCPASSDSTIDDLEQLLTEPDKGKNQ